MIIQSELLPNTLMEAAARWGTADALVSGAERMSWSELNSVSDRIAHAFRLRRIHAGERIVFCAAKHPLTIAGLYGALKAGGVCVPVDTGSPPFRLQRIIEDCAPSFIVYSEGTPVSGQPDALTSSSSVPRSTIADFLCGNGAGPILIEQNISKASDVAYLLYTSGSTGQPKGVMLSHKNMLVFAEWAAREFQLGPRDRVGGVSPLNFDLSIFDIFSSAIAGATMVLADSHALMFPVRLAEWLEQQRITVLYTVPSVLAGLAERGNLAGRRLDSLRAVLFAGEPCPPRVLDRLLELLPHARFANLYGPTETNVCTFECIDRDGWNPSIPISIGRACPGTKVVLIDNEDRLIAQPGKIGELVVYGPVVSKGYWRDEERTRRRYRPPADVPLQERCFRTGDFAEIGPHGKFIFHGRRDHMVKVRGHRVELGEIEAALCRHPLIAEAAVVLAAEGRLIAFVRGMAPGLEPQSLLEHCAQQMPRHMVPAEIRILAKLPRGSAGKIDRGRLERMAGE